jgi:hypothetical protein
VESLESGDMEAGITMDSFVTQVLDKGLLRFFTQHTIYADMTPKKEDLPERDIEIQSKEQRVFQQFT